MALFHLLAKNHPQIVGLIVDHGLRENSAHEAETVRQWIEERGFRAHILRWPHGPVTSGLQAKARTARHGLLYEAARHIKASALFFAHHFDDQIETVALRRRHNSGRLGLAGMPWRFMREGVLAYRPLLSSWRKEELLSYCQTQNIPFVSDPSNNNLRFERVALRQELAASPQMWAETYGLWRDAAHQRQQHLNELQCAFQSGTLKQDHEALFVMVEEPMSLSSEAWHFLLALIGQPLYAPSAEQISALKKWVGSPSKGITLGGCHLEKQGSRLLIARESNDIKPCLMTPQKPLLWDKRFLLSPSVVEQKIEPLGTRPWRAIVSDALQNELEQIPALARKSLPFIISDTPLHLKRPSGSACLAFDPLSEFFI